ncbi:hypothetical protein GORBP_035_00500 [Gordonia rubripertincta NBRC 101908]|uniref:Uncharacterized protein n=1 Tax=Gordonia rubripertincta NBRC 101908 TaxID=1077975 RepID=A0ABQ0HPM4_GORRU|nr:hypothetical protein GORBP_035_00500 [Gordonia rubripertincta NBRC 101908]
MAGGEEPIRAGYPGQSHEVVVGDADPAGGSVCGEGDYAGVSSGEDRAVGADVQGVKVVEFWGQCCDYLW